MDSAADYSTISIAMTGTPGRMPHVRVDQTIRVNGRYNLAIECPGGHTMSAGAPGFYWGGVDGATVLNTSGSSAVRQLISAGDVFPDYDQFLKGAATFYQFDAKAMNWGFGISVMGGNQGGNATVFDCNHGNNELKAAGVFVLCADGSLRQLQLSQDGQSFKSVMP